MTVKYVAYIDESGDHHPCAQYWCLHGEADTMAKEPSGLVGHFQGAVHLMGADALLAAAHQVHGLQPLVKRDMAFFKNGAHAYREPATAIGALVQAMA